MMVLAPGASVTMAAVTWAGPVFGYRIVSPRMVVLVESSGAAG